MTHDADVGPMCKCLPCAFHVVILSAFSDPGDSSHSAVHDDLK